MSDVLIVFAKYPEPGQVKTRLTDLLTDTEAAELYQAFLLDALDQYAHLDVAVRLYMAGAPAGDLELAVEEIELIQQEGKGLGERMERAFMESFIGGHERAVIIGTDHPSLPLAFVEQAFVALQERETVVVGPSSDGGYYLLGMNDPFMEVFDEMSYSHGKVFDETLERIQWSGAQAAILPEWYDVDTPETLRRLVADQSGWREGARRTARQLDNLCSRYPELRVRDS